MLLSISPSIRNVGMILERICLLHELRKYLFISTVAYKSVHVIFDEIVLKVEKLYTTLPNTFVPGLLLVVGGTLSELIGWI